MKTLFKKILVAKRKLVPFAVGALIILIPVAYLLLKHPQTVNAQWWPDGGNLWKKRQQLNIVNSSASTIHANSTISVTVDTSTLAAQQLVQSDCDDLRVLYQASETSAVELDRYLVFPNGTTCTTSTATKVYFELQADLASAASASTYYIYYSNPDATTPTNTDNAFDIGSTDALLVCPFNSSTTCAAGETASTASGALRYSGGKSALSFDGISDYVQVTTTSALNAYPLTIEAWIYHYSVTGESGITRGIITKYQSGDANGYSLYTDNNTVKGWYFKDGSNSINSVSGGTLTEGWHHVAFVVDSSGGTIYVDGAVGGTLAWTGTAGATTSSRNLKIASHDAYKRMLTDEVRVSNVARYTTAFAPSATPFTRDDYTLALFHLDENGDDPRNTGKALDDSGNANHGTITGAKYVSGLVGVDNSSTYSGYEYSQSYAGHEGILVEEGTTNEITNPSFENATSYDTNWTVTQGYALDDEFTDTVAGGSINGTSATPGPGTRAVTDGNSVLSTTGTNLSFATGGVGAGNPGLWYGSQARTAGKLLVGETNITTSGYTGIGWSRSSGEALPAGNGALIYASSIVIYDSANYGPNVGSYSNGTSYKYAVVLKTTGAYHFIKGGAFTYWTLLHISPLNSAATLYPGITTGASNHVSTHDFIRVPTATWLPTPLAYDTFSATYPTQTEITGPDGQTTPQLTWTGGAKVGDKMVITPTTGSELITNGNMETGDPPNNWTNLYTTMDGVADERTGGGGIQSLSLTGSPGLYNGAYQYLTSTAGTWLSISAWAKNVSYNARILIYGGNFTDLFLSKLISSTSWANSVGTGRATSTTPTVYLYQPGDGESRYDDISVKPLTLSSLFSTVPTSDADVVASVDLSAVTTGTQAGLVLNLDSASSPDDFILVYHNGTQLLVDEVVNGTYTNKAATTVALGAGALTVVRSGTELRAFLNNAAVGSVLTMTANTNTIHGLFSTYSGNTFDNFSLFARGTGGEYASILAEPSDFLTATENTTAPYYKFGSKSVQLVDATNAMQYATSINPGNTNTHTLSAYVYDGTTGNVGGTVSSSIAKLVFNGATVTPASYTDMGGGWWRLSYSAAGVNASGNYGVEVQVGKTIYLDGVQLEEKADATTYTDGTLGTGYAWTGTAHDSTSTRTETNLQYATSANIEAATGSISFWVKPVTAIGSISADQYLLDIRSDASNRIALYMDASEDDITLNTNGTETSSAGATMAADAWQHFILTYNFTTDQYKVYKNGSATPIISTTTSLTAPSLPTNFVLGGDYSNASKFNGVISDIRTSSSVYSTTEVADLYNAGLLSRGETAATVTIDRFSTDKGQNAVSIWNFDEGNGTTAHDSGTNLNHLTISGATWTRTSADGIGNKTYLKFDGSNDYAYRTYDKDFDFSTDSFSVGGWFKHPSAISGTDTILARYGSAGFKIYMNSSGYVCFDIDADSTWSPADTACSTTSYADSNWHYFEAVKNGTTSITLYIDSNQAAQDASLAATTTLSTGSTLYVGIDSDGSSNPWDGYLDGLIIYPYARSADQVKTDNLGGQISVLIGQRENDNLTDGLVGWWKLDETATPAVDSSGNGNSGTWQGNATYGTGKYGNAGSFDGLDDSIIAADSTSLSITGTGLTLAAWIYPNAGTQGSIIHKGLHYSLFRKTDGTITYADSVSYSYGTNGSYGTTANSTWSHIAATFDGTNRRFYVNGVLVGTKSMPGSISDNSINVLLGCYDDSGVGGATCIDIYSFNGKIDDARVYKRALTASEIVQLYDNAPAPVAEYKLDEGTGQYAYDSSGGERTGTLGSGATADSYDPTWVNGKFGNAAKFDGSDDYIQVGSAPTIGTSPFTMTAWVNAETHSDYGLGFFVGNAALSNSAYLGYVSSTVSAGTANTIGGGFFGRNYGSGIAVSTGWHHLALVYDGSYAYLYADGVQKTSDNGVSPNISTTSIMFGRANSGAGYPFKGSIDNAHVYNYALTAKQITKDMNAGHPATDLGSATVYYKLDEGTGTTANNAGSVGSTLNGTITSGTWNNNGKFGKAVTLTASSSITETLTTDPAYSNAISIWVYPTTSAASKTLVTAAKLTTDSSSRPVYGGCTGTALSLNTWTHIVAMSDGASICKIYQNGALTSSSTTGVTFGTTLNIGGSSFIGSVDEFKLYYYPLSADEVKVDYNHGSSTVLGASSTTSAGVADNSSLGEYCVPSSVDSCSAPILELKMDEGTGQYVYDTSGSGNTGTLGSDATVQSTDPIWTNGKTGNALKYDGTNDYITLTTSLNMTAGGYTVTAWVYVDSYPSARSCIVGNYWFCYTSVGNLDHYSGSSWKPSTNTISTKVWTHIAQVINADGSIYYYMNGIKDPSTNTGADTAISTPYIGAYGPADYWVNGKLDQVRVYNYVRTPAQIAWDYNRGGPVGWWKMDECTGTTIYDASGNANNGTWSGTSGGSQTSAGTCGSGVTTEAWNNGTTGEINASLNFDGTDDYVNLGTDSDLAITGDLTISAWIKPTTLGSYEIIGRQSYVREYALGIIGSEIYLLFGDGNTYNGNYLSSGAGVTAGVWQLVTVVRDTSAKVEKFYVNGKYISQNSYTVTIASSGASTEIGRRGAASLVFPGQIDDVRVYNYALTSTQIKELYNGGAVNFK